MRCMLTAVLFAPLAIAAAAAAQTPASTAPAPLARLPIPATPGKTFDLAWLGKMVRVSDPQIAPDGKSLVAVVTHLDYENDLNVAELALVDMASGKTRFRQAATALPFWRRTGKSTTRFL
jgi:hypothetical protein